MERLDRAIAKLGATEAYLVSDRTLELYLRDGRRIRITAAQDLRPGAPSRFTAAHEVAFDMAPLGDERATGWSSVVTGWGPIDLPRAGSESIEDCLARAVELITSP